MNFFFFLFFGIAPSLIWLWFYLRQDAHPEPKWQVRKIFLWGMVAVIPVLLVEVALREFLQLFLSPFWFFLLYTVVVIAVVEELGKYSVVRLRMYGKTDLDEPADLMIYMIVAALGFAALENVLYLFDLGVFALFSDIAFLTALRFLGATLMHALAAGLFGYFLALSLEHRAKRRLSIFFGLFAATLLHGFFNFSILYVGTKTENLFLALVGPAIMLSIAAVLVLLGFRHLRSLKSVEFER